MPAEPAAARMLALGDSYTIGEGVPPADRWPAVLCERLRQQGLAQLALQIVATTGWTCAELSAAMDAAELAPPYALVSLCIGVNDQYRGGSVADYADAFPRLLGRAIALAGGRPARVLVLSIPDWSVTRFAREHGRATAAERDAINAFNDAARAATADAGARWVDITPTSRECASLLADDGLHPSAVQYRRWLPAILAAARAALWFRGDGKSGMGGPTASGRG